MIGWFFRFPSFRDPTHLVTFLFVLFFAWWCIYHPAQAGVIFGDIGRWIGSVFSHVNQDVKTFNPKTSK